MFYLDVTGAEAAEGAGELVAEALPALPFDFSLSFLACVAAVEDEDEALLLPDEEELVPPLAAADGAAVADVTALEPAPAGELLQCSQKFQNCSCFTWMSLVLKLLRVLVS